jgi:hypothetical protein
VKVHAESDDTVRYIEHSPKSSCRAPNTTEMVDGVAREVWVATLEFFTPAAERVRVPLVE